MTTIDQKQYDELNAAADAIDAFAAGDGSRAAATKAFNDCANRYGLELFRPLVPAWKGGDYAAVSDGLRSIVENLIAEREARRAKFVASERGRHLEESLQIMREHDASNAQIERAMTHGGKTW